MEVLDYKIALEASEACELKKKTFLQSLIFGDSDAAEVNLGANCINMESERYEEISHWQYVYLHITYTYTFITVQPQPTLTHMLEVSKSPWESTVSFNKAISQR